MTQNASLNFQRSFESIELKMNSLKLSYLTISCLILILNQFEKVHSQLTAKEDFGLKDWFGKIAGKTVNKTAKAFQDPVTRALCHLKTVNECLIQMKNVFFK